MLDIQLILVDIDGTLLNDEGTVSQHTIDTIAKLKANHIMFGIATGRTPYAVKKLQGIKEIHSFIRSDKFLIREFFSKIIENFVISIINYYILYAVRF